MVNKFIDIYKRLRRFLVPSKTRIHIFARDKASEGNLISNMLRIVDENIVIEKATTDPPMIEFIKS